MNVVLPLLLRVRIAKIQSTSGIRLRTSVRSSLAKATLVRETFVLVVASWQVFAISLVATATATLLVIAGVVVA
jgi:hypothetical protein